MKKIIKVLWQTFWQAAGKGITSITTLVILSIVSRRFGSEGVGLLTLALTYLGFFSLIVDLGLNGFLLPSFLKKEYEKEWKKLLGLRLFLSLFSVSGACLLTLFWKNNYEFMQLILIGSFFSIFQQGIFTSAAIILQSKQRYDLAIISTSFGYAGILVAATIFNLLNLPLVFYMGAYSFGWTLIALSSLVISLKFVKNISPIFDFKYSKAVFKESWTISATLILNLVYFRLDAFLISFYRNFAEVGIYNLSYQIFQTMLVLPAFIMNSYYPLMIVSLKENKKVFLQELKKATVIMLAFGVLVAVITFVFAEPVVNLVSGEPLSDGVALLKVLSTGFPLFFISALFMWVLVTIKEYKNLAKIYLAGLTLNGLLNLLVIPQYSYWGASLTTVFSEGFILVLQALLIRKKLFGKK